ncbi:MAG: 3-hydroxyacyl-CoA dehydrogenase NAD-binding domain-containing protein, partial [Halalkalicoccus sp.]
MHVTVLGAGTMGHGIAQVAAWAGHDVTIRDIDEGILEEGLEAIDSNLRGGVERGKVSEEVRAATLDRIETTTDLEAAVADAELVVEAVPEDLGIKHDTFEKVEAAASDGATLASNTSSLSVTEIASALEAPDRAIGLHFFNPVHIMGLVEVVVAEQTSEGTVAFAESFGFVYASHDARPRRRQAEADAAEVDLWWATAP